MVNMLTRKLYLGYCYFKTNTSIYAKITNKTLEHTGIFFSY